jgi:hypothetical protein
MKKERSPRPPRKMKPVFLVFCEGETEEAYINFLRLKYQLPVKVIPRITGISISPSILQRYIQAEKIGPGDRVISFLMYDLDTENIAVKLAACKGSINIASNPGVELWFLLHIGEQNAPISTNDCLEKLKKVSQDWGNYKKGFLSEKQNHVLWNNRLIACERAKGLQDGANPSSMIYHLIERMNSILLQEIKER